MNSKIIYAFLVLALLGTVCPPVESKSVVFFNYQGSVGKSFILNGRNVDCPKGQQRDYRNRCRTVTRKRRKGNKKQSKAPK